jgi:transposase InsO family protein
MGGYHATGGWRIGGKQAIVDLYVCRLFLEGYRRLTFMMLDDEVVAVSPSSTYQILKAARRLDRRRWAPSKKGTGFVQPEGPRRHWHTDISYLNLAGTFYFLIPVLDGYSRYIVHWEIRETMKELDTAIVVQGVMDKYPDETPRIISDNRPQFVKRVMSRSSR